MDLARRVVARYLQAADYQEYVERKKREGKKPLDKKEWEARVEGQSKPKDKSEKGTSERKHKKDLDAIDKVEKAELAKVEEALAKADKSDEPGALNTVMRFLGIKPKKEESAKQQAEEARKQVRKKFDKARKELTNVRDVFMQAVEESRKPSESAPSSGGYREMPKLVEDRPVHEIPTKRNVHDKRRQQVLRDLGVPKQDWGR